MEDGHSTEREACAKVLWQGAVWLIGETGKIPSGWKLLGGFKQGGQLICFVA